MKLLPQRRWLAAGNWYLKTEHPLISQRVLCFYIWKELNLLIVFNTIRKIFFRDRIRFVEPVRTKGYAGSFYLVVGCFTPLQRISLLSR